MKHYILRFVALLLSTVLALPSAAITVYVSSEKDNTITVIDGDSLEVINTVSVGNRPRGIELSPNGKYLYICASDDNTIEVMDTDTLRLVGQLPSGPDPELLTVSPDGKTLYVANEDDNQVTVVDIAQKTKVAEIPVGVEPEGMAVSHDGRFVVNTSETTNMVHFIDVATRKITDNILVGQRPRFAQFTSDDAEVWVTAEIGGAVSVIDNAAREIKHNIVFPIPGVPKEAVQPVGVRILKDRSLAFVALGPANRVAVINAQDKKVEGYILTGQRVWQLALSPDEKWLYTTNGNSNDITVIDVDRQRAVKSIAVGRLPWGVAVKS